MKKQSNAFSGVITALITPFKNGKVDFKSLEKLVNQQLQNGVNGFVINGTTAESPTLSKSEVGEIFAQVKKLVPKNFPLIVGSGSNSTEKSIADSKDAEKMGADALLLVVPYYNKPQQRGLFEHFKSIASSVSIPSLLYNVPGRTVTALELETIRKLAEHPQIIGIKEASGKVEFAGQIRRQCGEAFVLLSGDDGTYDDFMKTGGNGVISVASHIIPKAMIDVKASEYSALIDLLFVEANPVPVKAALQLMGIIDSAEVRLPLVEMSSENKSKLVSEMTLRGLIK